MMKNKNYLKISDQQLAKVKQRSTKARLLLHSCCAPCSSYVLRQLSEDFVVTVLYNNSNIQPLEEYQIRFNELKDYIADINSSYDLGIEIIEVEYQPDQFIKQIAPYHQLDPHEGGARCHKCYRLRMEEAYQYALAHQFDYFTTVMTISRQKNSAVLNKIGEDLNDKYQSEIYYFSDFKKRDGLLKSKVIIDEYQMYRQDYCGCYYSMKQRTDKNG